MYKKEIKAILKGAKNRHGFIDRPDMRRVGNEVYQFLTSAQEQIQKGNSKTGFLIATAVLEEMTKALQFADDSNADIGNNIYFSIEILTNLTQKKIPEVLRKEFFKYCLSAFKKGLFDGWDWHFGILDIAGKLILTEQEGDKIFKLLDAVTYSGWELNKSQAIQYELLSKIKGEVEAEAFLKKKKSNPEVRLAAIQKAFSNKDYEKAIAYAKDGIKECEKKSSGWISDWYNWLLKIGQKQEDKNSIIQYARYLYLYNYRNEQNYYSILKKQIPPKEWHPFVKELLIEIQTKESWRNVTLIREIYIEERWWDRLLRLLQESPDLRMIDENEQYLKRDYPNELIDLYAAGILLFMAEKVGRKYYKAACRYIRKIKRLGHLKKAKEVETTLRDLYPQRKALLEELDNL